MYLLIRRMTNSGPVLFNHALYVAEQRSQVFVFLFLDGPHAPSGKKEQDRENGDGGKQRNNTQLLYGDDDANKKDDESRQMC